MRKNPFLRMIAGVLCAMLIFNLVPLEVFAVEQQNEENAEMQLVASSGTGMPGDVIQVTVEVRNNPGLASLKFSVAFDSNLILMNVEFGSEFGAMVTTPEPYSNPQPITMISPLSDITADGVFATLTFKIAESAPDGYDADVNITFDPDDIFNGVGDPVQMKVTDGTIRIVHGIPGDIDGDKKVNTKDAILLFRYVAGWDVEVQANAVDVNGDGTVNTKDAILLFRYVAGWDVEIGRHNHTLTLVEAKAETCTEDGNSLYFYCSSCKKSYTDATAKVEVALEEMVIPAKGHAMNKVDSKEETCTENGHIAHWNCENCGNCFADENGNVIIAQANTVIPAKGHDLVKITEKAASCTESGNITYWFCESCEKSFTTKDALIEIDPEKLVISAKGHALQEIAAKDATCTQTGNIHYWYCSACQCCYSDAEAKTQIPVADTVVPAKGHGEHLQKVDAKDATFDAVGNTEYWKCSECGKCYGDAAAKNEITEASTVVPVVPSYTITFVDKYNWPKGEEKKFAQDKVLILTAESDEVPPSVTGYRFLRWLDKDGNEVRGIDAGNTKDMILCADWKAIKYTITYKDAPKHSNKLEEYTVEDEIVLQDAEWSGLAFKNWTDEEGNVVTKIEKGTTGNITLTANWMYEENMAVPVKECVVTAIVYDEENNRYFFIYELGVIDNVVLDVVETQDKEVGESLEWTKTETVTVSKEISDSVARTITSSVTQGSGWSSTRDWAWKDETSYNVSAELNIKNCFKIAGAIGHTNTTENTSSFGESGFYNGGFEDENSLSSTVSYTTENSGEISTTTGISAEMPEGTYSNVCVGKVRVYAVVTYDPETKFYHLNTYSALDDSLRGKRLYTPSSDTTANISYSEGLAFDIPTDEIESYVDSVYYVNYNANGGTGTMLHSAFRLDQSGNLLPNAFERTGYVFTGWGLTSDGGALYSNKAEIKNLAAAKEILTLYAIWDPVPYTVTWMNGEGYTIKVERTESPYVGAAPGVLKNGDIVYYGDKLSVTYSAITGYHITTNGAKEITVTGNVDQTVIHATAEINTYTVIFDSNGGTGNMGPLPLKYGQAHTLTTNAFTRTGWAFVGWKDQNGKSYTNGQTVINLAIEHGDEVKLYAVWSKTTASVSFSGRDITLSEGDSHTDKISTGFNKQELLDLGYDTITIKVVFDGKRKNAIQFNYAQIAIVARNTALCGVDFATGMILGTSWTNNLAEVFSIKVSDLNDDGSFSVKWSHLSGKGNGEAWHLGTTTVTVTATKA